MSYGGWPYQEFSRTDPEHLQRATHARRNAALLSVATLAVVAAVLLGAGLGHLMWPGSSTNASLSTPTGPASGGSSGNGFSPFGGGSSGSTGNSATGAGAPSDISAIASKVAPGLVDINTNLSYQQEQAAGTGMVLTPGGEVLTNNHVIDGATSISVTDVGNGKTYSATVVGYDRTQDVAVIQLIGASGLQTVRTASGSPSVGQAVVGVGNAGGTGGTPSTAGGSITALDQAITASDNNGANAEHLTGLIEDNVGIQPGDSGGPLVNTSSQVLGMDTAASQGTLGTSATQAYAIPITTALSITKRIELGRASSLVHIGPTAFIGVSVDSPGQASSGAGSGGFGFGSGFGGSTGSGSNSGGGSTTSGAAIVAVVSGSPASRAGLVPGDVITGFNGTPVTNPNQLTQLLEPHHPGNSVQLQWTDTSGQTQTGTVVLTNGPPA
ncbi:MAG: S1C family serine protease [Acidimicrobiales bacterium]